MALPRRGDGARLYVLLVLPLPPVHKITPPCRHPPAAALTTSSSGQTTVASSDYSTVYNDFWLQLCSFALLLQFLLFWLNVTLPVYPLDGGRVLVAGLSYLGVGLESAAYIVAGAGLLNGGLILLYGLLGNATTAALGLWVVYEAYNLRRKVANGEAEYHPLFTHYIGGSSGPLPTTMGGQYPGPPGGGVNVGMPPPYMAGGPDAKGPTSAPSGMYGAL